MNIFQKIQSWQADQKRKQTDKLTQSAAELNETEEYDLVYLFDKGFVRVSGNGQSITYVHAEIKNLIDKSIRVVVKPGTYFKSTGAHQNMATTKEYRFTLDSQNEYHFGVDAVCINAGSPIPGKADRFLGVARTGHYLARFLEASRGEDPYVIQAGVWTLSDGYTRHDIKSRLVLRDSAGNTRQAIYDSHCDRAKEILEKLEIKHKLWYSSVAYEKKTVQYDNGTYTGEFRYGERHGEGCYEWAENDYYDGQWEKGKKHGKGTRVFPSGEKYVGQFKDGVEVHGALYYPNGRQWPCFRNARGEFEKLSADKFIVSEEKKETDPLLLIAAAKGDVEQIRMMLDDGMDINITSNYGTTALIRAVEYNHLNAVQLLIERGADVNQRAKVTAMRPLKMAKQKEYKDIYKILVDAGAKEFWAY